MSTPLDTDHISRIEAALKDEPTLSQWEVLGDSRYIYSNDLVNDGEEEWRPLIATIDDDERLIDFEANARFIAACNPVAIRALLAERDALKAENEKLLTLERDVLRTLPGVYYMDPPDGGDASLLKQLERMSNDAARYRLLRRKFAIISDGEGNAEFCPINLPRPTYIAPNTAIELDTALDRERLGLDGAKRPPTPVGWSDTDWIKHLQEQDEQPHPLAGQHINQGSMDAAADAYEAEYNAARGISEADKKCVLGKNSTPPSTRRSRRSAAMSDQQARQTPIIDLLRDIPADARMVYEVTSTHHQSIPVGVLAKQAADEIERLTAERDELRRQLAEAKRD